MRTTPRTPVLALPSAIWRGYRRHRYQRAAMAALRQLDDHMLEDIGMHRGDLEAAFRARSLR